MAMFPIGFVDEPTPLPAALFLGLFYAPRSFHKFFLLPELSRRDVSCVPHARNKRLGRDEEWREESSSASSIESHEDASHFLCIRENVTVAGIEIKWAIDGIPGFWDNCLKNTTKEDLERECHMSKKVDSR